MTAPVLVPPPLNEPLMTLEELAVWTRVDEIDPEQVDFAWKVIEGASVVVRSAGSLWWVHNPDGDPLPDGHVVIPYRAKLLLDLKAKNFFEHPTGAVSETTGPISERYLDEVVQQIQLTDAEQLLLTQLAAEGVVGGPSGVTGIWALSTRRGALETHQNENRGVIQVPYWRYGSKPLPYYAEGAFGSPEE
jgi:hypothetical protein